MKTVTTTRPAPHRVVWSAATVLALGGLVSTSAIAITPTTGAPGQDVDKPVIATDPAVDPYLAYLEALDVRGDICRQRSTELRVLLRLREMLAHQFAETPVTARGEVAAEMENLDRKIDTAESALEASLASSEPTDAPGYVPPPPVDREKLSAQAWRTGRTIYPPVPQPSPLPALPAPPREALYLAYLSARAGDSTFAQGLVADITQQLRQRREMAYRYSRASAADRQGLETAISAVSQRIRASARAAAEQPSIADW
jgi:hypothetical protein